MEYAPAVLNSQPKDSAPSEGLTIVEAAKLAPGISEVTIRQAVATGLLRATILDPPRPRKSGRGRPVKILIAPADLAAFLALKKVAGGKPASRGVSS